MILASGGFYADGLKGVFDSTRRQECCVRSGIVWMG